MICNNSKPGFTLIELLVVIATIGTLVGFISINWINARSRGQDHQKKTELQALQQALLVYQLRFGQFPTTGNGLSFNACGTNGNQACPVCPDADFAVGGADGCELILMPKLTRSGNYFGFRYYPCDSGTSYRLKVQLDNASDADIAESQARCPAAACGLSYSPQEYVVCHN